MKLSLRDLTIEGKVVLMRVDFNVPLNEAGEITSDARIQASLPSIQYVLEKGGALILMAHLGRPKGRVNEKLSLKPVAKHLSDLIDREVMFAPDCVGKNVETIASHLKQGDVLLLENLRFHQGEEYPEEDKAFGEKLARLGNLYVNDAFGAAHRNHASIVEVPLFFPNKSAMGFLMEKEVSFLSQVVLHPKRPFYAIIGGAKIGTKLGALKALTQKINAIFIGGGMAFTFLKAQGVSIGASICDDALVKEARVFLKTCAEKAIQVHLPKDIVITDDTDIQTVSIKEGIPDGWKGMDIGPETIEEWSTLLVKGTTIFWNGPMGVFEEHSFSHGTKRLAQNLSTINGKVIVGGGDSVAAISSLHLQKSFAHLSTGGGASLEFIEHGTLPGIEKLTTSGDNL